MASGEFKHIAVTAAEEEDEVIHVGVAPEAQGAGEAEVVGAEEQAAPPDVKPVAEAPVSAERGRTLAEVKAEAQPTAQGRDAARGQVGHAAGHKADPYRQTTLEDLNSQKMPLVQKIVIIAAVLCIIGAIGYYLAFMR